MGVIQVHENDFTFRIFETQDVLFEAASHWLAEKIGSAISMRGEAKLALSGGSTPRPLYQLMSDSNIAWEKVWATQVDDRITQDISGSNAAMIKNTFLQNKASQMTFKGLGSAVSKMPKFDVSILGMGTDGHTASWFPGIKNLSSVLDLDTQNDVEIIDVADNAGAKKYPRRITLTLPAIMNSQNLLLLITGAEKRRVFEASKNQSVLDSPVKALLAAGPRLTVMWAP